MVHRAPSNNPSAIQTPRDPSVAGAVPGCTSAAKQEPRSRPQPFQEEQGAVAILLLLVLLRHCQGTIPTSPLAVANDCLLAAFQRAPEGVSLLREPGGGEKRLALHRVQPMALGVPDNQKMQPQSPYFLNPNRPGI